MLCRIGPRGGRPSCPRARLPRCRGRRERSQRRLRAGMFHIPDGALQPARFVRKLASRAISTGVELRSQRVASLDELEAEHVVIATDGSGRGLLAELDDAIWPARGQVVATEPLGER